MIFKKLLIICLAIAVFDAVVDILFPDLIILANFNLFQTIMDSLLLIGSLVLWIGYFVERLTAGEVLSSLMLLYEMLVTLGWIFLGGFVNYFFDLIILPFKMVSDGAKAFGIDTLIRFDFGGQYASFDLATFTFRSGIGLEILGNGTTARFQVSFLGAQELKDGGYTFPKSGFLGLYINVKLKALGQSLISPNFNIGLEALLKDTVDAIFSQRSSLDSIYNKILEALKRLGVV